MISNIIAFSVRNKMVTGLFLFIFCGFGIFSLSQLSIDALPDVTNNQVQVITNAPNLATQEVEQFITFPLEMKLKNAPGMVELRSTSRSGLSVITVVFKDNVPVYQARQLIAERMKEASEEIPSSYGIPYMVPPTTGLGEIFQYTLAVDSAHTSQYDEMELRTIQDWIVKRQLLGVPGVVDVSSFGGKLKQYEVSVDPKRLLAMNISLLEIFTAIEHNNANTGGSYIEKDANLYFIRGEGLATSLHDLENVAIKTQHGMPVYIRDVATVKFGFAPRYGAMMRNGQGETVGAVVLMMKGENSVEVIKRVKERVAQISKTLPPGVSIDVFVDRSKLIDKTIGTVKENLLLGALIVIFVLVLVLGNWRAGLIVASMIPLSMLFAVSMMNLFDQSANLMSMGALDFGLIVDGAVIIVESMMFLLHEKYRNSTIEQKTMDEEVISSSSKIMSSAVFGQLIILIVYVPIFALVGIEGKMFKPMAFTVSFAIVGALLLSLTYVPLMSALFLSKRIKGSDSLSERAIHRLQKIYTPLLEKALKFKKTVVAISLVLLVVVGFLFSSMGGEFIPELDEGDMAINYTIRQGSSLKQTMQVGTQLEKILLSFPEVKEVVSKIGSSEIPTDPMPIESADLIVVLKDKDEWTTAHNREELAEKMEERMSVVPGVNLSFEQPIQMRFNELIAGVKSAIAIKIYGENLDILFSKANEVKKLVSSVNGAVDIKVEQITGMPQLVVKYNRDRIAQYGLNIDDVNKVLNTALAGGKAGIIYEGEKRFDLVVRLADYRDADIEKVKNIFIPLPNGSQIPIAQVADVSFTSAPAQVSRDNSERRIVIETNVRGRDIQSVATEIAATLDKNLNLPAGYHIEYGGTFQNLQEAKARLVIAVPVALLLIFVLLFFTFRSFKDALLIFSAIPLAAIGGVLALYLRGMNFSISAGVGFIALFGVAVLNGIVLISYFKRLAEEGEDDVVKIILEGTASRLRPVLATAAVASLGFLPMALSNSEGSEVQKPLATVVIGGLISSTLLTLFVLPVLYSLFTKRIRIKGATAAIALILIISSVSVSAQSEVLTREKAVELAIKNYPSLKAASLNLEQQKTLKKNSFTLDPLAITYQGGQINSNLIDYNISALTGISFPNVIAQQGKLANQKIALAEQGVNLTKSEVIRNVRSAYEQLLYANEKLSLLSQLDSFYADFASYANKKFVVGESNSLEKISAQAESKQVQLEKAQAEADVKSTFAALLLWTGSNNTVEIEEKNLTPLPLPTVLDTSSLRSNPYLQYQTQQLNVSRAEWKLEKAKWAPPLQFGYFNQSLDKVYSFHGWSIGTLLPLFKTGQNTRVKAAQLQSKISESNLQQTQMQLTSAYTQAIQQFNKQQLAVNYYTTEGLQLANSLRNTASRSYQAGDIGYVEYLQNTRRAFEIQVAALSALRDFNQSIIELNFLFNK